jgi:hypothetical protein
VATNNASADALEAAVPHCRQPQFNEDHDGGDFLPTYHKLDFPKFDDTIDPLPWFNRCEHYFWVCHTSEHK